MYIDPTAELHASAGWVRPAHERRTERAARRRPIDLLVRYAWKGLRATVMLKDVTRFGARIEGIEALRKGDGLTLLLPGLPACDATVAWAAGSSAGLLFEAAVDAAELAALIRDYAPAEHLRFTPECLQRPEAARAA